MLRSKMKKFRVSASVSPGASFDDDCDSTFLSHYLTLLFKCTMLYIGMLENNQYPACIFCRSISEFNGRNNENSCM